MIHEGRGGGEEGRDLHSQTMAISVREAIILSLCALLYRYVATVGMEAGLLLGIHVYVYILPVKGEVVVFVSSTDYRYMY